MKRKLVIMAISLVFFLGGFFIINSRSQVIQTLSNSNSTIKANREFHEDMDYEIIDSHLSLVKKYENIEDLKKIQI